MNCCLICRAGLVFVFVLLGAIENALAQQVAIPRRLSTEPDNIVLGGARSRQRLLVTAEYDGGLSRDVSGVCRFQSSAPTVVTTDEDGVLQPVANGSATITVSLGDKQTTVPVSVTRIEDEAYNFKRDILPVLSSRNCNQMGCHGSPKGKSSLRLSLFGADPQADYEAITRSGLGRLISPQQPLDSLLLLKGTGTVPHGGEVRLKRNSGDYHLLVDWIAHGTPRGSDMDPSLVRIDVFPKERVLDQNGKQPLLVEAYYSDGSMADVTHLASLVPSDEQIVTFSNGGVAAAIGTGEAVVVVRYGGHTAVSRLSVPQALPMPIPSVQPNDRIDELVLAKLRKLNIPPAELSTDSEFLRRIYLDVLGVLPTPDEVRAFMNDQRADKRERLIDAVLLRPELTDMWTLKWGDLLRINRGFPIDLGEKSMLAYHQWVHKSIADNKPMNQFVRELLTSQGNGAEVGPSNFFRVAKEPQAIAEQAATVFLGIRLDCAHCHNHPFEQITWDDNYGLAAFFARVKIKRAKNKDEEEVYLTDKAAIRHAGTGQVVKPRFLNSAAVESDTGDLRARLADWVTAPDNPWFARNLANRLWYWTIGRGIVHEPDDFRSTNPPSNPELLDYLANELVSSGYDMKHVLRLILSSRTYQASSKTNEWNARDQIHFSHYSVRRLSAEQLLDAISQVTGVPERFAKMPVGTRAGQLPDGNVASPFLDAFGRPQRAVTCECERSTEMHVGQSLQMISSDALEGKLASPSGRVAQLLKKSLPDPDLLDELYLAALCRLPTPQEKSFALSSLQTGMPRNQWAQDLLWALMNTKEFLFNH